MVWRSAAMLLAIGLSGCASDATSLRQPPSSSGLLGIAETSPKIDRTHNGRKEIIYDAQGGRDYRRDFDPDKREDRQRQEACRLDPADDDCLNRRF